jgi:ATP-dependent protease ClpP protease subunit
MTGNEIILYGSVGMSFWDEPSFDSAQVREQLAGMTGDIVVRINSGGGIASEGAAIYTLLKGHPGKKHVVIDAVAASAASLIAMAGDEIVMRRGAWMLIHDPASPWLEARGTEADHLRAAKQLGVMANAYADVYAARAGIGREEARQIMKDEVVLDGAMALQLGFATATDDTDALEMARFNYKIYAHAPEAARAASQFLGEGRGQLAILASIAGLPRFSKQEPQMAKDESNLPTATGAERTRARRITEMTAAAGLPVSMATDLIADGLTLEDASDRIVAEWRKGGDVEKAMLGGPRSQQGTSWDDPANRARKIGDALAAAIAPRMGLSFEPTLGREFAGRSVYELIGAANRGPAMSMHTSGDFPLAVASGLTAVVNRGITQAPPAIARLARVIDAQDYRTGNAISLTGSTKMQPVAEGGEIKSGTLDERGEVKAVPENQALMITISQQALVNDSTATNILADAGRFMLRGAVERQREILLAPLLANSGLGQTMRDGQTLFHSTHGNVAGTAAAITVASVSTARTAMRRQKDSQGNLFAIEPRFLLVAPEKETEAQQLVADLAAATVANVNPFPGVLEVVTEPGLTAANAWYLVASPDLADGLTVAYLNGQNAPLIESREAWETLGTEFRMLWPMGAAFHEYASWFRNAGA